MLADQRRNLPRLDDRLATLVKAGVLSQFVTEGLFVKKESLKRLVQVNLRIASNVEPDQIAVALAETKPAPGLHEGVRLTRLAAEERYRQALDGEASTELRSADQDSPDHARVEIEC